MITLNVCVGGGRKTNKKMRYKCNTNDGGYIKEYKNTHRTAMNPNRTKGPNSVE